jgi:branched-chain amino acid transport system permease protein
MSRPLLGFRRRGPVFLQILVGALVIGSIYGLVALGYSLIYSASGLMSFVQGELLMIGAFLGLTFYKYCELPFLVALLLTMLCMYFVGVLIEKFIIRKLQEAGANTIFIVVATIALSIILQNLAMVVWGSSVFQFPPIFSFSRISIGAFKVPPEAIMAIAIALLVMLILHFFMTHTRIGTAMRAAAQDPMAAKTMNINVSRTTSITWGIASMLTGVGGMLIGPIYGVSSHMGVMIGLKGFAGAVIGGYGNMYGAIVGSLMLGSIETFTAAYISSMYKDFISFFILILFLIFIPRGLFKGQVYGD